MITIFQAVILGVIQGVAEWLPISSEAMVNIIAINIFDIPADSALKLALLLHVGTVLAALIYFRKKISYLIRNYQTTKSEWLFLIISSVVSVGLGGVIYLILKQVAISDAGGSILTIVMGLSLLVTAYLLSRSASGMRGPEQVGTADSLIIGVVQGLAVVPGISRSGSTTAGLIWRGLSPVAALELSFLMGIPMIVIGATLLVLEDPATLTLIASPAGLVALATTLIVGLLTINVLMKLAIKLNFSKLVLLLGLVTVVAGFMTL